MTKFACYQSTDRSLAQMRRRTSVASSSEFSKRIWARPECEPSTSHSSSQEFRLGRISANVVERPTSFDQRILDCQRRSRTRMVDSQDAGNLWASDYELRISSLDVSRGLMSGENLTSLKEWLTTSSGRRLLRLSLWPNDWISPRRRCSDQVGCGSRNRRPAIPSFSSNNILNYSRETYSSEALSPWHKLEWQNRREYHRFPADPTSCRDRNPAGNRRNRLTLRNEIPDFIRGFSS
jgi:hypothetical protein